MSDQNHVYVGTAGHSVWFSEDEGEQFVHPNSHSGMYLEARVWSLSSHSLRSDVIFAGTDMGLYFWSERSARWTHIVSPMSDVWALAQHPKNANILLAGTRPGDFYRSDDGGHNWNYVPVVGMTHFSEVNMGPTRVTQILFDPRNPNDVWASVEIGGIYHSQDAGKTWQLRDNGLVSKDVHGVAVATKKGGSAVLLATTNKGLHKSLDEGHTWSLVELRSPWQYTRAVLVHPNDSSTIYLTNGNGPPGNDGKFFKSTDYGETWRVIELPGELNSTPWCIAMHPSNSNLLFVSTNLGQLFKSQDAGESFIRLGHEFGEIRSLLYKPMPKGVRAQEHSITRAQVKDIRQKAF